MSICETFVYSLSCLGLFENINLVIISTKKVLGRATRVDVPDLELKNFYAKVDTGAYSSSIHCEYVKEVKKDGQNVLEFQPIDNTHKIWYYTDYSRRRVKSSNGHVERRYCINLQIIAEGVSRVCPVTLSDRTQNKADILLGRTFLSGKFIIDTSLYVESRMVGKKKI